MGPATARLGGICGADCAGGGALKGGAVPVTGWGLGCGGLLYFCSNWSPSGAVRGFWRTGQMRGTAQPLWFILAPRLFRHKNSLQLCSICQQKRLRYMFIICIFLTKCFCLNNCFFLKYARHQINYCQYTTAFLSGFHYKQHRSYVQQYASLKFRDNS